MYSVKSQNDKTGLLNDFFNFLCPEGGHIVIALSVCLSVHLKFRHTLHLGFENVEKHFAVRFRKMWKKGAYMSSLVVTSLV